jgi:hypothetical protein
MIDVFLVPDGTVITANGDSDPAEIGGAENRAFLLVLSIRSVVEQESIELSVFISNDGTTWEAKPIATLPQKFYVGEYPLLVDLAQQPQAKFLRVHWDVSRWGRGSTTPRFEIGVRLREVPSSFLQSANQGEPAQAR